MIILRRAAVTCRWDEWRAADNREVPEVGGCHLYCRLLFCVTGTGKSRAAADIASRE